MKSGNKVIHYMVDIWKDMWYYTIDGRRYHMNKLMIDRDFLAEPLDGMDLVVFLSAMDLATPFRDCCVLYDLSVYFNITDKIPNAKQRKEINDAFIHLIDEGYITADIIGRGLYLINCRKSFYWDIATLPHGAVPILFNEVKQIVASGRGWQGMLRYYLMLSSHMNKDGKCSYSRRYFADKLGISELTLSKYNTMLNELGILDIASRMNMPNVYGLTNRHNL